MPRLMERKDWMQTVADVESVFPISMPESGMYRVILVKVGKESSAKPHSPNSARDYIGCCRGNFNGRATTAEIMKELREGEE